MKIRRRLFSIWGSQKNIRNYERFDPSVALRNTEPKFLHMQIFV